MNFDESAHRQSVRMAYPDFAIDTWSLLALGQNCVAYVVNSDYVFRFPKYPDGRSALAREAALLHRLAGRLPLPIPTPKFVVLENSDGPTFLGYPKIPGTPLSREALERIGDDQTRQHLGAQLGGFLRALHVIDTADGTDRGLPIADSWSHYDAMYRGIRTHLFEHMSRPARETTAHRFETFLEGLEHSAFTPCLRHGDFGPTNILSNDSNTTITGILDSGATCLGDPAYDLAGAACYGPTFLQYVGAAYPGIESLLPRAEFYQTTFALQEALFGVEHSDQRAFESGMASFR